MSKLLIVVDYQKDFVDGALGFAGAEKLEEGIAALVAEYVQRGEPVVFTLRAMTYNETRQLYDKPREDQTLSAVLYGCKDPDFRDKRLLDSEKGIVTPLDAIKARLFAGEIDELHIEIQKLSGYLRRTLAEVKNA